MSTSRPQPLRDAAVDISATRGAWMGLITTLVSGGVIGLSTAHWLTALAGLLPGFLAVLSTSLGAFGVAIAGEPKVTPISHPMTELGGRLVSLVPVDPSTQIHH